MVGELATHPAVGAYRVDLTVGDGRIAVARLIDQGSGHQGAGGAGLNALATGHAGAIPHRVVEIKHDLGRRPPVSQSDHVVNLYFATGTHTQVALDAGVKIDAHGGVAAVLRQTIRPGSHMMHGGHLALFAPGQLTAHRRGINGQLVSHGPEMA